MYGLFNLKMDESAFVTNHIYKFNGITFHLSAVEIKFNDGVIALIFFSSLRESSRAIVTVISFLSSHRKLELLEIRDLILHGSICMRESDKFRELH